MSDYLKRFRRLARELARRDHIQVVEFTTRPPASAASLAKIERRLKAGLSEPIRGFYRETNGLRFQWEIKPNVSPETAKALRRESPDYYVKIAEYVGDPFAVINILPLEESLLKPRWKELALGAVESTTEFRGVKYDIDEFVKRLKPFDIMNREYCMAFLLEEGKGDPAVLLLTEGYTDWNSSRLTNFASYMEMLLVTRGIVEAREKIFGEPSGDRKPPLIPGPAYWREEYVPKLFRK